MLFKIYFFFAVKNDKNKGAHILKDRDAQKQK